MKIALSPCPNDTYLFYGWIKGQVGQRQIEPHFADIKQLNTWAVEENFPLIKISIAAYPKIAKKYQLLSVGAALGFNCGPKVIAKTPFCLTELKNKTVALPGDTTTAHLLFDHFCPTPKKKIFCLYHEINTLIQQQKVDSGVIIHESRFTFPAQGLVQIADLGELWHQKTGLPLPLGGLAIARDLTEATKQEILNSLKASLFFAHTQPKDLIPYVLDHSQEKDVDIVQQHIKTYVNKETEGLSDSGKQAIESLLKETLPKDWIYHD